MKTTVNFYEFRDGMMALRPNNFTYEGLEILFEGLEQFEEDTGKELDFDPIAICCDFCEMSEDEIKQSYNVNLEESSKDMYDWLSNQTWVLGYSITGSYVFRQF
jgi:hypothetical protein